MKKSLLFTVVAAMLIFVSSCKKDDDTTPTDDNPNTGNTYTGINKVSLTINGTTQDFVFADQPNIGDMEHAAMGSKQIENSQEYTEIVIAANGYFDHITNSVMTISYFGSGTGTQDISYGLGNGMNNFIGSSFMLVSDTATMPTFYSLDNATANITNYGDVGGYIEGTFNCSEVSLNDIPQPNITINGNFKVKRYDNGK
ncbi:MAG: hypothetical protein GXO89_15760 [Chlorobi bacterium]|nr:hypothetical protein [Chlorobiota bacterium]